MKIFNSYGTKERLFEMMKRVNNLNEIILPKEERISIINDFVKFVCDKLKFNDEVPKIRLSHDESDAQRMKSFGEFKPETNEIVVVDANRNLADVLRTIGHELKHRKQKEDGKLGIDSGKTGSDVENEANSFAGIVMREFGKINPKIFE